MSFTFFHNLSYNKTILPKEETDVKDLGNKLLLFLICSYFMYFNDLTPLALTALTAALSISSLCTFFKDSRFSLLLLWGYLLGTLMLPLFSIYLPLLAYDICQSRHKSLLAALGAAEFLYCFQLSPAMQAAFLVTTLCALLLYRYASHLDLLRLELHRTQDDSQEFTSALQERNHALIQNQDSEIRVATLSERNRIARSIHDNVGHLLTRSLLQTGALIVLNHQPDLKEPLSTLHDTLNTAMTSIRESVHDLHDESIDLHTALKDIIQGISSPSIELEYDMGTDIPRDLKYTFIIIVKEAVNNIQKHSNATTAQILVREHPGFYQLHIQDNGSSAALPLSGYGSGIGLSNMTERVHALDGTIDFRTEHGFQIAITIMKKEF